MSKSTLLLLPFLFAPAPAQRPIEPIRVQIVAPQNEVNLEASAAIRAELRKLRDVAIVERRYDYKILLAATPVDCGNYAMAVVLIGPEADSLLQCYANRTIEGAAAHLVEQLNNAYFNQRRERIAKQ